MARFSKKQAQVHSATEKRALDERVRAAEKECAEWSAVAKQSRLTYEACAARVRKVDKAGDLIGWDLEAAAKGSRGPMKAGVVWVLRKELKALLKEAKRVRAKGMTGQELMQVKEAQFVHLMDGVDAKLRSIAQWQNLAWNEKPADPGAKKQQSHKQRPATDSELVQFYEKAAVSIYAEPFLVAEFSGCRGEEFATGIRVEAAKVENVATLRFSIESAKSDGDKKGLDLRCVESSFPANASREVQERWMKLAKLAAKKNGHFVQIKPTPKSTVGALFSDACRDVSKAAGVHVRGYSLRNRFSAQVKQSTGGDAVCVALALGHQTTDTQKHYARANRSGSAISPMRIKGVKVAGVAPVRGENKRMGPRQQIKDKQAINAAVPAGSPPSQPSGPRL